MSKQLRATTIIPGSLYIERNADRQLQNVLDDMGRPGYVLVARQMGKTNLLMHIKKQNEDERNVFVYVDLSNLCSSSRQCFRNIIDTAIESRPELFSHLLPVMSESRRRELSLPYKEHEHELKLLLQAIDGKLVIQLDEVDALTKVEYSDEIFAQIRSMYFNRVNFHESERLTYILSGVAEPSELIKNKKISPFNIGEKIYLDDFSRHEVALFFKKTGLPVPADVEDRIYHWTNGHPRMTWDVTSAVEDVLIRYGHVSCKDVDRVVSVLYLESFDTAPIDNIRDVVQNNVEIRRSVLSLIEGKDVNETVKRKMYLAGIIKANISNPKLKNEVIKSALNLDWLKNIDSQSRSLFTLGNEQFQLGNYREAITCYKDIISGYELGNQNFVLQKIGICYSNLGEYQLARDYFNRCQFDLSSEDNDYFMNLYNIGLCFYKENNYTESIKYFKDIIDNHKRSIIKCRSFVNYGSALVNSAYDENKYQALEIFRTLLKELENIEFHDINDFNSLRVVSLYNIGFIKEKDGLVKEANEHYSQALQINLTKYKPYLCLKLFFGAEDSATANKYLKAGADYIVDCKMVTEPSESKAGVQNFTDVVLFTTLAHCFDEDVVVDKLFDYVLEKVYTDIKDRQELLLTLSRFCRGTRKYKLAIKMATAVLGATNELKQQAHALREIGLNKFTIKMECISELTQFSEIVADNPNLFDPLQDDEIIAVGCLIMRLNALKATVTASQLFERLRPLFLKAKNPANLIGVYYLASENYGKNKQWKQAVDCAKEGLRLLEESGPDKKTIFDIQQTEAMKKILLQMSHRQNVMEPVLRGTKIGRNDKCPCGSGKKYKHCCG